MPATTHSLYPNSPVDINIDSNLFSLIWNPDTDEIIISNERAGLKPITNPEKVDLIPAKDNPRSSSTYSINFENSQIRLKYLDGHRVAQIRVQ